ncbi:MAG: alpha/beta hydrolase [Nostocaceae cyanobacterium]|nr:alpha/beta hydrolase [Nostocaceae cyanobacterium]
MNNLFRNSRRKLSVGLIFWREVGGGIPVVFLHGPWHDSSQWVSIMELLSEDFHCLAPDLLGFGESDFPNVHHSIDLHVECLAELLASLKLEKVHLVGHSLGGWIAASYALKYPEKIYNLVLLAPEGVEIEGSEKRWQKMQSLIKRSPWVFKLLRMLRPLTKILGLDRKIEQEWRQKNLMLQNPTGSQLLFLRQQSEIHAELLQNQLHLMAVSVLILQGGKDISDALMMSHTYAKLIPQVDMKIIDRGGGDLPELFASIVAGEIRDFIQTQGEKS